ncbi:hypothetical protein QBC44DRAFT_36990 [Cladorrhinum sp. PSN332]|nr:hypothetical protein QBC44DRAFT_36990 [Cladorrhinum sp. PSN332]
MRSFFSLGGSILAFFFAHDLLAAPLSASFEAGAGGQGEPTDERPWFLEPLPPGPRPLPSFESVLGGGSWNGIGNGKSLLPFAGLEGVKEVGKEVGKYRDDDDDDGRWDLNWGRDRPRWLDEEEVVVVDWDRDFHPDEWEWELDVPEKDYDGYEVGLLQLPPRGRDGDGSRDYDYLTEDGTPSLPRRSAQQLQRHRSKEPYIPPLLLLFFFFLLLTNNNNLPRNTLCFDFPRQRAQVRVSPVNPQVRSRAAHAEDQTRLCAFFHLGAVEAG